VGKKQTFGWCLGTTGESFPPYLTSVGLQDFSVYNGRKAGKRAVWGRNSYFPYRGLGVLRVGAAEDPRTRTDTSIYGPRVRLAFPLTPMNGSQQSKMR
jgi:hypothetical protein